MGANVNEQSARPFFFVKIIAAKQRLNSTLSPGNQGKSLSAPVTVIIASNIQFFKHLPEQFPAVTNAKAMFESNAEFSKVTAERNGSMKGNVQRRWVVNK